LKKPKVKYQFSVKKVEELDHLSHEELLEYVKNLTNNLVREKPPKNSNNSSIPPSLEIVPPEPKKNQSLRSKGGKNGGQFGHKGETLKQTQKPDEIVDIPYTIEACKACGFNLEDTLATPKEKRQVLDLDLQETMKKITQYQSYSKVCPNCGEENHDNNYPSFVAPNCKKRTKSATHRVCIRPPKTLGIRPPLSLNIRPLLVRERDFILG